MIVKQLLSYLGHVMQAGGLEATTAIRKVAGTRREVAWLGHVGGRVTVEGDERERAVEEQRGVGESDSEYHQESATT